MAIGAEEADRRATWTGLSVQWDWPSFYFRDSCECMGQDEETESKSFFKERERLTECRAERI
jgi:hypothetical protein